VVRTLATDFVLFETKTGAIRGLSARSFSILNLNRGEVAAGTARITWYFPKEPWEEMLTKSLAGQQDTWIDMYTTAQKGHASGSAVYVRST
jgi:hypothetical protein